MIIRDSKDLASFSTGVTHTWLWNVQVDDYLQEYHAIQVDFIYYLNNDSLWWVFRIETSTKEIYKYLNKALDNKNSYLLNNNGCLSHAILECIPPNWINE